MEGVRVLRPPGGRPAFLMSAAAVGAVLFAGCRPEVLDTRVEGQRPSPCVRVRLGEENPEARVSVRGAFEIHDLRTGRLLVSGEKLDDGRFTAGEDLAINGRPLGSSQVVLVPRSSGTLRVRDASYRGELRLLASAGKILLVNALDLEDYLVSVVGKETYPHWHLECLKAQAVAARSYALYWMKQAGPSRPFDVYAEFARSQAYAGAASESEKSREAVVATRGIVLAHGDRGSEKILEAVYHSTCGGHTVPFHHRWPSAAPIAPLMGVECEYCSGSPRHRWEFKLPEKQARQRLKQAVPGMGDLGPIVAVGVRPEDLTRDGRVVAVSVWTGDGVRRPVPVEGFKKGLAPDYRFYSDRFTVALSEGNVIVEGRGFGHGVGLCQYGAQRQAQLGRRAEGILHFYYPGSRLVKVY